MLASDSARTGRKTVDENLERKSCSGASRNENEGFSGAGRKVPKNEYFMLIDQSKSSMPSGRIYAKLLLRHGLALVGLAQAPLFEFAMHLRKSELPPMHTL